MAALRAGHPNAFEAIYDRYNAQILAFCRQMLGSREDAEDAAQHVFVSAHRDLTSSERDIELRPWLYTIARNRCLSMLRARRETATLEDVALGSTAGLAETVQRREELRELVADLGRLPEEQREALVLFELGDLSQTEIAQVLDRDPNQVKALVFQARTSLMGFREARQMDCGAIREELATARGADLLRGHLRRHLRTCDACKEYSQAVKRQRADLALLLPVIPTAGLKAATLAAAGFGGGAAGGGAAGGGAGLLFFGAKGAAVKVAAGVLLAAGAVTTATVEVTDHVGHHGSSAAVSSAHSAAPTTVAAQTALLARRSSVALKAREVARRRSGALHAARAKERAKTEKSLSASSSTPAATHKPATVPVRGAKRQSTGHAQKSRRATHTAKVHLISKGRPVLPTKLPNPNSDSSNAGGTQNVAPSSTGTSTGTTHAPPSTGTNGHKGTTSTTTVPAPTSQ